VDYLFYLLRLAVRSSPQNCKITSRNFLRATNRAVRADLENRSTRFGRASSVGVAQGVS
jgi:hypothetical protein